VMAGSVLWHIVTYGRERKDFLFMIGWVWK